MNAGTETHAFDWQGIPLSVAACPDWLGTGYWHLEIRSVDRRPHPVSETGYRSHFVSGSVLDEWGGFLPYVRAWLDAEGARPEWQAAERAHRQLTLF